MKDVHKIFSEFKKEFPEIHEKHAALGEAVHQKGGPLSEKTRWLIKIAISATGNHKRALETHIHRASAAGVSEEDIKHALLLLIPTAGFPTFMKSYAVLKSIKL